ncbi:hypothetical protein [Roseobacter ponti]|uniref:Uncharacterized protein n=1 Tax=Roseobacter ponti TaxID=1891787 RepID=A0A858SW33_9RHOB|nr:hypothetical protein [Roseobacter ponti]QJF52954.1 hypothetical protein G3256_18125 [Roseobacter ponti]
MSIDPRSRRLRALNNRMSDRVLIKPARHRSDLHMPDSHTVAAYIIRALKNGITSAQLEAETGWSRSTVRVNLHKIAKKCGIGVVRRDELLYLVLPDGSEDAAGRPVRVINPEDAPARAAGGTQVDAVITL